MFAVIIATFLCLVSLQCASGQDQDQPEKKTQTPRVFSGPQKGEKLARLPVRLVGSKETVDVVRTHGGNPHVIIFLHKLTRPGFALTRALNQYTTTRSKDKLQSTVVFLTSDPPAAESMAKRIAALLPKATKVGISPDGAEGPGAYGLNRNVLVTVLVAKEGRVTANYALGQPSALVDGPKILKDIATALGGGKVPEITDLMGRGNRMRTRANPKLEAMLRGLMGVRAAEKEKATQLVNDIEKYVGNNATRKAQLGRSAAALARTEQMKSVPHELVRRKIKEWTRFVPRMNENNNDPRIRSLLQPLIQKDAGNDQVLAAARQIEVYVARNPAARRRIGDICRRIINAGRLETYGTPLCQDFMKKWAREFQPDAKNRKPAEKAGDDKTGDDKTGPAGSVGL